ncbi:MAG: hypothetical protein ACREXS_12595, partial [Gammaproteobacteria bacterium]
MTEDVDNLIIEHLRAIRADVGLIRNDIADMKLRISSLEEHVAGMRRDLALLHSDIAVTHKRLDHHDERL